MSRVVTLEEFTPGERFDGNPWTAARIEESGAATGSFTALETFTFGTGGQPGPDADPKAPQARSFTTQLATLAEGFYRVVFLDAAGHEQSVGPIFVPAAAQSYVSIDSLRRVLSPDGSPTDTGSAASLPDEELEQAIAEASDEVNARLSGHYTVPFLDVPPLVSALTRDIAAYLATLTFRRGDPIDANDPVQKRYDRAMALLTSIQSGKTEMAIDSGGVPVAGEPEVINTIGYDGDLFSLADFSLGPSPARIPGIMPSVPFGNEGL